VLAQALGWEADQLRVAPTRNNEGPGNALMVTIVHEQVQEVVTSFGEKGLDATQVAQELLRELAAYHASRGALGPHLADQWMLPLALAVHGRGGVAQFSCTEMTDHSRTNMAVIERFLPLRFLARSEEQQWLVSVSGR
jgi:RNA 3'-terminal phosphate cyclase (ATP)